jgi:adenylate cyclase
MAFWNAPVPDAEHAARACRAALAMQAAMEQLNREEAARKVAAGEVHLPVRIGIGLNTGACCVGNVGSPQRFDYSLLGDPVNVAARIEEATKVYGAPILAGERTAQAAAGFAFLEVDTAASLKGKERTERLFALVGDEATASSPAFAKLSTHYTALRGALAEGDRASAKAEIAACRAAARVATKLPLEALFAGYEARLERG